MSQDLIEKILIIGGSVLSGAGIWNIVKDWMNRNKTKAETDNIIAQTYKELVIEIRKEVNGVRTENTELHKEVGRMRMKHYLDMEEEKKSCNAKIQSLNIRIFQLENSRDMEKQKEREHLKEHKNDKS